MEKEKSTFLSRRDIALLLVGFFLAMLLFVVHKQSLQLSSSAEHLLTTTAYLMQSEMPESYTLTDETLEVLVSIDSQFRLEDDFLDTYTKFANFSIEEKEVFHQKVNRQITDIQSRVKIWYNTMVALLFVSSLSVALVIHKKNSTLKRKVKSTSTSLLELNLKLSKSRKLVRAFNSKWKDAEKEVKAYQEKQHALTKEIAQAESLQMEMKVFIDKQIETNEQLMIAENRLKKLLEKEQESKSILNQTLARLKDTQGQLVHSEKMASLGQLTAGIAHEINNPINFVYNGIDSLKRSLVDFSEILDLYAELDSDLKDHEKIKQISRLKEELEYSELRSEMSDLVLDIKEGAVRTIEIVKGLRVFSRLDEEDMKDANINECLDATLVLLKNKTKGVITITKNYDNELPEILCYPGQLNQVFMNIINNAIQAMPEEKKEAEIIITTKVGEGGIEIRLKDNGTGMSEEVQNRIFEPFFTTKPVGVGTGLGMSISYGIIEKHHGDLLLESTLGVGTEFIIKLPSEVPNVLSDAS